MDQPDSSLAGRHVTIMGLGTHGGGVAAARYVAEQGASVTITDTADETRLSQSIAALQGVPIAAWHLGRHDPNDFRAAEIVVVNPAIKPDHPLVRLARQNGALVTSEIELFLNACPAAIGVTGSNGKSTTATMLARITEAAGRCTWLGGNIGHSLLAELPKMAKSDLIVLELSSFQLCWLSDSAWLPELAVFTGFAPNHLDWHGTLEHYRQAKQRLLPRSDDTRLRRYVLDNNDPTIGDWVELAASPPLAMVPDSQIPPLNVPGEHNRKNARLAASAALALGCSPTAIRQALSGFPGLPHRLELVAERRGRRFYNDSKATTPQATMAALTAIEGRVWLLAGGVGKGMDYHELIQAVAKRVAGAAFFGTVGQEMQTLLHTGEPNVLSTVRASLEDALHWVLDQSQPGDAILLSPAAASYDQFRDYMHRGETFCSLVATVPDS